MFKRKEDSIDVPYSLIVLFQKIDTDTSTFSNHHPHHSAAFNMEARAYSSKKIMTH